MSRAVAGRFMADDDKVINICFHGIGSPQRELEPGEQRYWIDVDQYLRILDELTTWPSVRITFDDGNASDVQHGLPALLERDLSAQFFVLAGRLGSPGSLDVDGIHELRRNNMSIGTHGMAHRPWRHMDQVTRDRELVEARQQISTIIRMNVGAAACPLGSYDRRLLLDLRSLGYSRVYTSDRRLARASAWLQPRFSVRANDTGESLRASILKRPKFSERVKGTASGWAKRIR